MFKLYLVTTLNSFIIDMSISLPQLGQKIDVYKPCQHLVLALLFLSNRKYMYFAPFYKTQKYNYYGYGQYEVLQRLELSVKP